MILTFAKLQRLSGLQKPTAIKAWLKREGVAFLRNADNRPFTTLDALNRKLHRASDDGFTLNDPQGGLPEKRAVVSRRPQQVGGAVQGGRRASGAAESLTGPALDRLTDYNRRLAGRVPATSGDQRVNEAGI